jgi:protoporphyrinogen oxidase
VTGVAIIGAGLAGLSTAYHLEGAGFTDYQIFEKEAEAGGLCRSFRLEGFTFDYAIHILFSEDSYIRELTASKLLPQNLAPQIRKAFVYLLGKLTAYPFQAHLYGQDPEVIKECLLGLIKAQYEGGPAPLNFKEWIYATFGSGIAEYFMLPYNAKLWAIDPAEMAFEWAAERVPVPQLSAVIDGALKPPHLEYGPNSRFYYPLKGGIGALPAAFAPYVRNLQLDSAVVKISPSRREIEVRGQTIQYEQLVATAPLPTLASMLAEELPAEIRAAFSGLEWNSEFIVSLAVARPHISDCHWIYFPEQKYLFQRVHFPMNLSPYNGPEGFSSLTAEISVSKYKPLNMTEQEMMQSVIEGLLESEIIRSSDRILLRDVRQISPAYVIMTPGIAEKVRLIHNFLESIGIFPCGRYARWEYWNMDQAILDGKKTAERLTGRAATSA